MADYMLLLYNDPAAFDGIGPEQMQGVIEKYTAWRQRLADAGRLLGSDKLTDGEGRTLKRSGNGKPRILDGPFSETKEVIGGYFAIRAGDYDEAVELASDCPHLEYGTVEIREIETMHP